MIYGFSYDAGDGETLLVEMYLRFNVEGHPANERIDTYEISIDNVRIWNGSQDITPRYPILVEEIKEYFFQFEQDEAINYFIEERK